MDKSNIKILSAPNLRKDITFIQSLFNNQITVAVTRLFLEHLNPKIFAECYSPYFPDYLIAEDRGLCHLPRYEFYANNEFDPNIVLLTGHMGFLPEGSYGNYEVFHTIFNYARQLGCSKFISYGCFTPSPVEDTTYVVATSGKLASQISSKLGGQVLRKGKIRGSMGLLLGLSNRQGLEGVCILKPLADRIPVEVASLSIFNFILKVLKLEKD